MQRRSWCRLGAVLLVAAQVTYVAWQIPLDERWTIHPDDNAALRFANVTATRGIPSAPYAEVPYAEASPYPVFRILHSDVVEGKMVGPTPFGLSYLLALPTLVSVAAVFVTMVAIASASALALYFLLERLGGPLPGLAGLGLFLFSAPVLFWQPFLFSNLPALGFLALSVLLLLEEDVRRNSIGAALAVASVALRYEFVVLAGAVLSGWAIQATRRGPVLRGAFLLPAASALAAGIAFLALVFTLYGTVNFVGVAVQQPTGAADPFGTTIGATKQANVAENFQTFGPTVVVAFLVSVVAVVRMARRPLLLGFAAGILALSLFFLGNVFHQQGFLLSTSYTRYLIPLVALGAAGASILMRDAGARAGWPTGMLLGAAVIAAGMAGAAAASGEEGFEAAREYLETGREHEAFAAQTPTGSVIVGEHASKWITARPCMVPTAIPEPERRNETLRIVHDLLDHGTPVFVGPYSGEYTRWMREDGLAIVPTATLGYSQVRLE